MSVSDAENQFDGVADDDEASRVYLAFLEALNAGDLDRAERSVDVDRWREICVGFTRGAIEWSESRASMEAVWKGIPNVKFEPRRVVSDGRQVVAVGSVCGRQSGRLFGAPTTNRSYEVSMFDYARVEDGRIVDRIQQADMFGQMRRLFGPLLLGALVGLCVLLIAVGVVIGAILL